MSALIDSNASALSHSPFRSNRDIIVSRVISNDECERVIIESMSMLLPVVIKITYSTNASNHKTN